MSGQEVTGSDDGFRNAYRKSESDAGQLIGPIPYYANLATNMYKDTSNMSGPSYSKANADAPMSSGVCNPQGAPFLKTSPDVIGYSSSKGLIDKGTPYNVFAGGGNAFEGGGSMDDDELPYPHPPVHTDTPYDIVPEHGLYAGSMGNLQEVVKDSNKPEWAKGLDTMYPWQQEKPSDYVTRYAQHLTSNMRDAPYYYESLRNARDTLVDAYKYHYGDPEYFDENGAPTQYLRALATQNYMFGPGTSSDRQKWEAGSTIGNAVMSGILAGNPLGVVSNGVKSAGSALTKLAPGSSFWTNPITRQVAYSTIGGLSADVASMALTGNTVGGNVRKSVSDLTGWEGPSNVYAKMGYELLTDMANPGYLFGSKRPVGDLMPTPIVPSKMNSGSNLGAFDGSKWKDWGAESLVRWDDDFFYKVPKIEGSAGEIKTFPNHGFRYRYAVEDKLAANKIPSFEPYEYIGYHTTDKGYLPVFRQKKLSIKNMLTPEGKQFNKEAYNDIVSELEKHPNWNVFDYNLGHNIGKNEEGVGKLYDAWYSSNLFKWANRHFPREWELSPVGISRVLTNQIKNYAKE